MRTRVAAAAVAIAGIGLLSSCTAPVTDLGGASSEAYGINAAGVVVGVSELAGSSANHAFKRLPDNSAVDLGTLPGHSTSLAVDINDAGTAVGLSFGSSVPGRVVTWDAADQITDLGFAAFPRDQNEAGVFVGYDLRLPGRTEGHAFVYDPAVGQPVALPELPDAAVSYAWGLNDVGQAVGTVGVGGVGIPVVWDLDAGTVTDLRPTGLGFAADIGDDGTIVGSDAANAAALLAPGSVAPTTLGVPSGVAFTLNDQGTVVGHTVGAGAEAFRWDAGTGLVWLGTDGDDTNAYAINGSGGIVGFSEGRAAFLFPQTSP